jgi:DNA-directed RNA polymerase subunit K
MEKTIKDFTKYEGARIIGARALQISMDAPILLKLSNEQIESLNYDSLKIAQKELNDGVLPISINRPLPERVESKLKVVKKEVFVPGDASVEVSSADKEDEIVQELEQNFESDDEEESSTSESE